MAIPAHGYPATLDRTTYQYEDDYGEKWEILRRPAGRLRFLDKCRQGPPLKNPTYHWTEDITKVTTVTVYSTCASGDSHVDLVGTDWTYLQNGDLLIDRTANKFEAMQVDGDPASGAVTIIRSVGAPVAEQHEAAAVLDIIRSRPEASDEDDFEFKGTQRRSNYTSIISHSIKLSASAMEGKPRGYETSELDRQEADILLSLKGELEILALFGPGEVRAATTSAGGHGAMYGLRGQIVLAAGSNIGASAVTWSYKLIDDRINTIAQVGMIDDQSDMICLCPATMYSAAGYWAASACTRQAGDRTYGFEVNTVHSTLGLDVPLIWTPACKSDEFMLIDMNRFEINPLGGRSLIRMVKPKNINLNDYEARRLLMEWGCKLRYPDKAHYLQKLVTVPS